MAETTADKKTRLQKLAEQKAAIEAKLKAERERVQKQDRKAKTAENAKARKALTRTKIEYGGLCEMAGLLGTDKGAVLGALMWVSRKFNEDDKSTFNGFKKHGDEALAQRDVEKRKGEKR